MKALYAYKIKHQTCATRNANTLLDLAGLSILKQFYILQCNKYLYMCISVLLGIQKAWFCFKSRLLALNLENHICRQSRESHLRANHSDSDGSHHNVLHDSYHLPHFQSCVR